MSHKIDEAKNNADKYASMVLHYSNNAEQYLKTDHYHKASEMMWGAMSCVLKAVAAKRDLEINGHRHLGKFAIKLAKQEKDKDIFYSFALANMLHQNFYESNLDKFLVESICSDVARTVGKLMIKMNYRAP
jgi:hypothetical protein